MSLAPPPPPPPGPPPLSPAAKIENDWNNNIIIELVYYLFTRDTQKKTDPIHILSILMAKEAKNITKNSF